MASSNGGGGVPPGFRFHPTDEELLHYYLKKKITFQKFDMDVIREIDLNKIEPWDLQERCKIGSTPQNEWYFFSHKDRKYPTGSRTNRATNAGFWKATGRDKCIRNTYKKIGMRKTLVFYRGRAPHGQKTDWIMHEYRIEEADNLDPQGNPTTSEDGWVICRVFKKKNLFKIGNEGGNSNTLSDQHINNHQPRSTYATHHRDINPYLHLQNSQNSHGLSYSHIPLTVPVSVSQYSQIQAQNFMPHHHFSSLLPSSADHQSPLMVKQLMTNTRADHCESGGSDNNNQLRYDSSGIEVNGTSCEVVRDHHDNINDWGMLMNSQVLDTDDSSKGVRFEDGNGSSMNQINQLSLRGEMDFWGYGKQ